MKAIIFHLLLITVSYSANAQAQMKVSKVLSKNNVSIAYEVHGEGNTALVFVHGWSCDRSYWKKQLQFFSKSYRVVAVDLGGHGQSGLGRNNWTIYSFGSDVAAVVKKLRLQRVILIGHSMGGDVVADAARQLPGIVIGLVMVDTYKELSNGRSIESVKAFVNKFKLNFSDSIRPLIRSMFLKTSDPALVEFVIMDMSSAPSAVALSALESSFNHSREITNDLGKLKLPVFAINPDNEPTDTLSMQKHGVETVIMPGVGHFLMMEDPIRFNELLFTVVKKLEK